jgi:hypothetical protein
MWLQCLNDVEREGSMDIRHGVGARVRVKPLVMSLALAFAGAGISQSAGATTQHDIDAATPRWMSPADKELFRKQLEGFAAHRPGPVPAASIPVTNCDDSGAGSLRDAVNSAADGDTIDMTSLPCSTITLTSGAIAIGLDNLTIQGPSALGLTIDGNDQDRVFWHIGTGTLSINDVSVSHGHKYLNDGDVGNAGGACVFSSGRISFNSSWAKYCDLGSNDVDSPVHGGALYAALGVNLSYSMVTSSQAHSSAYHARGGGVYTPGDATIVHSTISGNSVSSTATAGYGSGGGIEVGSVRGIAGGTTLVKYSTIGSNVSSMFGGGAYLTGNVLIANSTISGNQAEMGGGLYIVNSTTVSQPAGIYSSTVTGNSATWSGRAGGIESFHEDLRLADSTIAFNTATSASTTKYGAGIHQFDANNIELQNTIISGNKTSLNFNDPQPDDIGGPDGATVTGANNLVYAPGIVTPGGTLVLIDPSLRALASNGGPTATHMPNFGSPVIDVGNNASGATVDQRGPGFPRIRGPLPDIGAVEFNLSDEIFANGFDP